LKRKRFKHFSHGGKFRICFNDSKQHDSFLKNYLAILSKK